MRSSTRYLSVAFVAVLAALLAVFAVRVLAPPKDGPQSELHQLLHSSLGLTGDQQRAVAMLEMRFAHDRQDLYRQLRAANAAIAAAYAAEHAYGPRVSQAIDRSHVAMGELQKLTLRHVVAMRAVLTARQARVFDAEVDKALTSSVAR